MKKAKSENDAVKIGEPVNILKVNVAGGMYSGVLMVVLTDGSEFFSSIVVMFTGSPILTASFNKHKLNSTCLLSCLSTININQKLR